MAKCFALLGWSLQVIESMQKVNKPFVVVSFPDFENYAKENDIPFVTYQFDEWSDTSNSLDLMEKLKPYGVDVAVPLFEETVEWAGALNSLYRNDPRILNRAFLFRNKAMMKRKALIGGLRVGLFEEVYNKEGVRKFMDRLNQANLQLEGEEDSWVHIKPFASAGTVCDLNNNKLIVGALKQMRVGLSVTAFRGGFQTTLCCGLWKRGCGER